MIPVKTKEHLIYLMQSGVMRLSKYDLKFVQNLQTLSLSKASITTNQVLLFAKLVDKYCRQLSKQGLNLKFLHDLPWESTIIDSDPKFTEAHISIVENKIYFRSPFNKKFLKDFREFKFNSFTWLKEDKIYESKFSTQALKHLLDVASNHYSTINYCPKTIDLLNTIEPLDAKYWNPTLVERNGNYFIAATTTHLAEALRSVTLDNNPVNLSVLASHGVAIDDSIVGDDPLLKFASNYVVEGDIKNVDVIADYLVQIQCDIVAFVGAGYKVPLLEKLEEANIEVYEKKFSEGINLDLKGKNNPVLIFLSSKYSPSISGFRKIIKMSNSLPIKIK